MNITFLGLPLPGHLNPTLPVVRELVAHGHRVSYPTTSRHADAVAGAGAIPLVYETSLNNQMPERDQWMTHMRVAMVSETAHVLPQLLSLLGSERPDLVVHDRAAFSGRMLAARRAVPTVQVVPSFAANAHWAVTQRFAPVDPTTPAHAAYQARLKALLATHSVAWEDLPTPSRQIIFLPKAFQYEAETFGDEFAFVGPCLRAPEGIWNPPASGKPVLLISMGSINTAHPDFYRLCFEAFGHSAWHVVMSIGQDVSPESLGPIPANFSVMPYVPQLDVLAHASVMLCHAGMGSTMEAIHFGVPLVHVPLTPEQEANAARATDLHLGVTLDPVSLSVEALRDAVDRATTDPTIAGHLRWMRSEIQACGGPSHAATVIESAR